MKLLCFILLFSYILHKPIVKTVVGCSNCEYVPGNVAATATSLSEPNQVTTDKLGNIYIAESGNNVVRKVGPNGMTSLVAGNRVKGYRGDGGVAASAILNQPTDIVFDKAGNMYVADCGNFVIRKINALGVIYTIAGNRKCNYSGDGGPAVNASIKWPLAIAVDNNNNLLIVDNAGNSIRKVSATGIITTICGNGVAGYSGDGGPATNAMIDAPTDVAVDKRGNIYVADNGNNRIRVITPNGSINTFAGTGAEGYDEDGTTATNCKLSHPYGIFIDSKDNVYVSDNGNSVIRKIDRNKLVSTVAGTAGKPGYKGDGGDATKCEISNPGGIAIDREGNLLVADFGNNAVRMIVNKQKK